MLIFLLLAYYSSAQRSTDKDDEAQSNIIGGDEVTDPTLFGYVASVEYLSKLCGGSIVSEKVILTAAHCVLNRDGSRRDPSQMKVKVGNYKIEETDPNEVSHAVARYKLHKDFGGMSDPINDVAVIFLTEPIDFSNAASGIKKVSLPTNEDLYAEGTVVTLAGWGGTKPGEDRTNILQSLEYEISDQNACKEFWDVNLQVDGSMICTGKRPVKTHAWLGDSGGPVVVKNSQGEIIQVALVSWGSASPDENAYDVNTNVFFYKDWIESGIEEANRNENWFHLQGGSSEEEGVFVYYKVAEYMSYTMCNDGVGQNEINMICNELGYSFGILRGARGYRKNKKDRSFDKIPYMGTKLECKDNAIDFYDCKWTEFSSTMNDDIVPCFSGEQLAVQCTDSGWEFAVTSVNYKVKSKPDGTELRGKAMCGIKARKHGASIAVKEEVTGMLLNVNDVYDVELITDTMHYRRKPSDFKTKIKRDDYVEHHCFVCLATLKKYTSITAYLVEDEDCKADDMDEVDYAVEQWIMDNVNY